MLVLLVLLSLGLASAQVVTTGNGKFDTTDGSMSISTNGVWMSLQWATLTEYDSAGNVVQSVDLENHHFGWSQPDVEPIIVDGVQTKEHFPSVNFTHNLINGAWFNVTAWLIDDDSNLTSAKRNDVKWNIGISNWPWVGGSGNGGNVEGNPSGYEQLVLNAGLVGFGGIVRSETNQDIKGSHATTATAAFANGFLASPLTALYDGQTGSVAITHTLSGKPEVFYYFGYFQNTMIYDPVLSPTSNSTNNGNGGSNNGGTNNGNVKAPSNPQAVSGPAQFSGSTFGISTNGKWMALQWSNIEEIDNNGNVLQNMDLGSHAFGWSIPQLAPVVDINRVNTGDKFPAVNASVQLLNGAWFNMTAWIFDQDSNNSAGKRNDVKWSVEISDWPWIATGAGQVEGSQAGQLVLIAGLVGFGGIVRSTDNKAANGPNGTVTSLTYGSGFLSSPTVANYDGVDGPVAVTHTLQGKPEVSWTFGRFTNYVYFDPLIAPVDPTTSPLSVWRPDGPAMISIYTILGVLLVASLVVAIYFMTRVKRNRTDSTHHKMQEQMDLARAEGEVAVETEQ